MNWTDQDIDNLLVSVEETIAKADVLAKSSLAKAGEEEQEDAAPAPEAAAAPAQDAPAAEAAPAEAAPEAAAADPASADAAAADQGAADPAAADAAAAPGAEGDQALEGEEEAPLSDEELAQIYGSMAPDELERHYSVIRQQLQAAYSQDQGQGDQAAAPGAEQAAPDAQAAAAPAAPAEQAPEEMMGKSEEISTLKKQVAELAAANEQIVKAFEVLTKPSRKSITDIQYIAKSEADAGAGGTNPQTGPMTVAQVKAAAGKLSPAKLEKSERDMVNKFFISGEGQEEVEKLIHSKGGK